MSKANSVHFVYLSENLPSYAVSSLKLAKRYSGLEVHLIGNESQLKSVKKIGIQFTPIESFYSSSRFESAKKNLLSPQNFRDGFWLRTLERFFVLSQFQKTFAVNEIFHAELDQLLFRADLLIKQIENSNKHGLFYPKHTNLRSIASVFYCNEFTALESFINYSQSEIKFESEMELLSNWAKEFPSLAFELPTLASFLNQEFNGNDKFQSLDKDFGIVDAAQIGQWIAGVDPVNSPLFQRHQTHFADPFEPGLLTQSQLQECQFTLENDGSLILKHKDDSFQIYNLHIHSKIHNWVNLFGIRRLLKIGNRKKPYSLKYIKYLKIKNMFNSQKLSSLISINKVHSILKVSFNKKFNRRPLSYPFISGDNFRSIANYVFEKDNPQINSQKIHNGDIVFCETDLIEDLLDQLSERTNVKITLLLGNSDRNFDKNLSDLFFNYKNIRIFSQNKLVEVNNVHSLPIGLENRWRANHGKVNSFRVRRLFLKKKTMRIMWSFSIDTNPSERISAQEALSKNENADFLGRISPAKHRANLAEYGFVACPPGNGLDTHRMWEAIYLKTLPIVLKSPMAEEFYKLGIPVWIVSSFDELKYLDTKDLVNKYLELEPRFNNDVIWMPYWDNRLKELNIQ